mgnify:CR=1 FL=1|jgi:manganese-dependent ADP-ribose/CDP-alcohol diphosphatase
MITRRKFIHTSAATLAAGTAHAEEKEAPLFSVGLIADAQYVDADPGGIRHYRNSVKKLGSAVDSINEAEVDFSIHLGDLIDRKFESFDQILEPLSKLKLSVIQIPGNHDFSVPDDKKPEVFGKLGMTKPYHSFSKSGFRFVFLDGTEVSTFANTRESDVFKEASEILKQFKAEGRKNAKSWNGAISAAQLAWLKGELAAAKRAGEKVIISCHYPILPDNSHNLWNDREVLAVIDQFPGIVAAWFNGHNHAGNYAERNGVHYVTVQGMVDTEDKNAFAVLDVTAEVLTIKGSGRVPSRVMELG